MNYDNTFYEMCLCGKTFSQQSTYTYHKRICSKTKKCLASALEKAKEVRNNRKRRRVENIDNITTQSSQQADPMDPFIVHIILPRLVGFFLTDFGLQLASQHHDEDIPPIPALAPVVVCFTASF